MTKCMAPVSRLSERMCFVCVIWVTEPFNIVIMNWCLCKL